MKAPQITETRFSLSRLATLDVGRIGGKKHTMIGLIEVDVTDARSQIRAASRSGDSVSFTAWLTSCVARTADEVPEAHALRRGRRGLVCFRTVDIALPVERLVDGRPVPLVTVIRDAARKSPAEIRTEIDGARGKAVGGEADFVLSEHRHSQRAMKIFYRLPQILRLVIMRRILQNPFRRQAEMGTIIITTVGAAGRFPGWIIPKTIHNLAVGVGSITKKPRVVGSAILPRDILHLTLLFDHDVIDGAPGSPLHGQARSPARSRFHPGITPQGRMATEEGVAKARPGPLRRRRQSRNKGPGEMEIGHRKVAAPYGTGRSEGETSPFMPEDVLSNSH